MKIEELITWMKSSGHYLINIRCSECSTIFMDMKGETFHMYSHNNCISLDTEIEIEDERFLGGTIGDLVTVKEVKVNDNKGGA